MHASSGTARSLVLFDHLRRQKLVLCGFRAVLQGRVAKLEGLLLCC